MTETARNSILDRLRTAPASQAPARPDWQPAAIPPESRVERFTQVMDGVHGEVHRVSEADWPARLVTILANKGVRAVLAGRGKVAERLAAAWGEGAPRLVPYDRPIEDMKPVLVSEVDAAVTSALGAIAETGSLVLWPTPDEPRLMSLLPPIHVAVVREVDMADTLAGLVRAQGWAGGMPTNAVLVSGPSKTADIEQTLAYGVHGPKELIVLVVSG